MSTPPPCPETGRLKELLEGSLPEPARAEQTRHVEGCERCQRKLEELSAEAGPATEIAWRLGKGRPAPEPALREALDALKADTAPDGEQAERPGVAEIALDFLSPAKKPGHLGLLGHYEVSAVLGRGGMGVVLQAFDQTLHRVVAIKVMPPQLAANPTARKRFVREAQAAAAVRNDHVIDIHAVEEANGLPYLAMEYIAGQSLQERLDRTGPLELKEVLRIGMQVAAGLAAAHAQGLIHRDVKPANILLENGVQRVKITDFGLARAVDDASLTQSGVVAGTPEYMAPEQARGEAVDHRADLFSLGSVLYACCTGRAPFRASGSMAVLKRVCEDTPRSIREVNPGIPDWLVAIVARLHAKDPARRFQSASEVTELLGRHLVRLQQPGVVGPVANLPADPTAGWQPARRRRRWAAAALLFLLGTLGLTEVTGATRVAATVIRLFTPDGTLVVQVDDPRVQVTVEGDGGLVIRGAGPHEVRLRPGSYRLQATRDGQPVKTEVVTIARGDRQVVSVSLEPTDPRRPASSFRFQPPPPGPLDRLDPATIPAAERFPWQPRELVAVLGEHRGSHWSPPKHVAVSPDGKLAASAGDDSLIYVWEADTLRLRALLRGHTGGVWGVAFAPDSRRLLTGGEDRTLRLWDLETGREVRCFRGHTGWVNSVTFSPDGCRALSGSGDRTVRLWDVETGRERGRLEGHTAIVCTVAFSPDGAYALSGGDDRTMRLWDVNTGKEVRCFRGHTDCYRVVCFLPDGRRALSCSHDHTLRLWDLGSGKELRRFEEHSDAVFCVAVSPDGRRAISVSRDSTACVWEVETGQRLHRLPLKAVPNCVSFMPGGQQALVGCWGRTIHRFDVTAGKELGADRLVGGIAPAAWGSITPAAWRVAFSPDGRRLLSCMAEDVARLWDVGSGRQLRAFGTSLPVWGVDFYPDGRRVLCAGGGGMAVWDAENGQEVQRFEGAKGIWAVALSADGRRVLTAQQEDHTLQLWDAESGRPLSRFVGHGDSVVALAWSRDERRVLSGSWDKTVRLWDLERWGELWRYEGHAKKVWSVALSPDGSHAASADESGLVRLWDLGEGEPRARPLPRWHTGAVLSLAFSPDGRVLASAGEDGQIVLFDVAADRRLHAWQLPGPVFAVRFAPDARHLAAANANGTVYILRLPAR
jgi:WD40 repeat protein